MVSDLLTIGRLTSRPVNHQSGFRAMESFTHVPVTLAAIATMTLVLSGCIAVDAASTVAGTAVDVGTTAVSTASDVVTAPFGGSDDSDSAKKH
jgi:hypothetical protein